MNKKLLFSLSFFIFALSFFASNVQAQQTCNGEIYPPFPGTYSYNGGEYRSCSSQGANSCGNYWCTTHIYTCTINAYSCGQLGWQAATQTCDSGYSIPAECDTSACTAPVDGSCPVGGGGGGGGGGGQCNANGVCNAGETAAACPADNCQTPDFTTSVSPGTNSGLNGETKYYYISAMPHNGAAEGTYTFAISGCPIGATCAFSGGSSTASTGTDTNYLGEEFRTAASKTVIVTPTSVTPGTYTLNFSATKNNSSPTVTQGVSAYLIINQGVNNSSCTSINAPSSVTAGQSFNVNVTMYNNGSTVWSPSDMRSDLAGINNYHVLVSPWTSGTGPWAGSRAPISTNVSPGGSTSVTIPVTAPTTPGTYNYSTQMLQEGVQWFGAVCNGGSITVTSTSVSQPNLTASAVGQGTATAGTALSFTSTISNTGNASTVASFSNFFQVATAAGGGGTITDLTATTMSALAASGTGTATSPSYTFGSAGTYSVRACADKSNSASSGTITESNESDNCGGWTTVTVSASVASCDPNAVGTNQMLGCTYIYPAGSPGFNTLQSTISALTGSTLSSPAPSAATPLPQTDWGVGGPGSLTDNYSVRWKGNFTLPAGTYTFSTWSDDGSRVYFDNNGDGSPDSGYLVNDWSDHASRTVAGSPVAVTAGTYRIVYEMYEAGGGAAYGLSWTSTSPAGTSKIIGKVCNDVNGNGICDPGEGYIRDTSLAPCTNTSSQHGGFSVSYSGAQSGSGELLDVCGGLGDPIYSIDSLPAGSYSVSLNIPAGWEYTNGCKSSLSGTYVNCPSSSTGNVTVAAGSTEVILYAARVSTVIQYSLTVTKPIGGTITTTDGHISCGTTCIKQYNQGSSVTLQAVPDTLYWRFVGWGGACSGQGTGNCTITINGNTSVTAQFRPKSLLYQEF